MSPIALSREQSRELDRRAVEEYGIASLVLMENAGRGCIDVLQRLGIDGPVAILCGKGNNAGDGFVMARHLAIRGYECRVLLLAPSTDPEGQLQGDAAANYSLLTSKDVEITTFPQPDDLPFESPPYVAGQRDFHTTGCTWLIDALLGTGAKGDPRPPYDAAIDWMNARPKSTRVLAVDVPSGLDCDTGQPASHTVRADHTCTFAAMKAGFTQPSAKPFTGTIHVCDIGVPPRLIAEVSQYNTLLQ
jgi:NAD(P)H-hydrate epimerase